MTAGPLSHEPASVTALARYAGPATGSASDCSSSLRIRTARMICARPSTGSAAVTEHPAEHPGPVGPDGAVPPVQPHGHLRCARRVREGAEDRPYRDRERELVLASAEAQPPPVLRSAGQIHLGVRLPGHEDSLGTPVRAALLLGVELAGHHVPAGRVDTQLQALAGPVRRRGQ